MKINRTAIFAFLTLVTVSLVYLFDYDAEKKQEQKDTAVVLDYQIDQINYFQIIKGESKLALQKNEQGWSLLEPIQDIADNDNVEDFLKRMTTEKQISVVKNTKEDLTEIELKEFGLDKPEAVFVFKNNLGNTKRISVGSVQNYEGDSYLRVDSENKVLLVRSVWTSQAKNDMIYYRDKRLFRGNLAHIDNIRIKSLRDDFQMHKIDNIWAGKGEMVPLDQNKVRELLSSIVDAKIEAYLFEGEPSHRIIQEKGLEKEKAIYLELSSVDTSWAAAINLHVQDKTLYALTERPTFLVRLEVDAWEKFGNLEMDGFKDRTTPLAFNRKEVSKLYFKENGTEKEISVEGGNWSFKKGDSFQILDQQLINNTIDQIHEMKISSFIEDDKVKEKFSGSNILILKSAADKLLLQLNWGPSFSVTKDGKSQDYYYTRTHQSDVIFAMEKPLIDSLALTKLVEVSSDKQKQGAHVE